MKMMHKLWKWGFAALTIFVILLFVFFKTQSPAHVIWVEIHDFSPGYGTEEMDELLLVLDRHQIDRIIVFVIPNRNENEPIHENEDFVEYLHQLQETGVEVGAHGYSHNGFEFYKSSNEVETLVGKSMDVFSKADIYPRSFYPPRYLVKKEGQEVLEKHYSQIFLLNKVVIDKRTYPYLAYEFLPGMAPMVLKPIANYAYKKIYIRSSSPVFRLNIHLGDIDAETLEDLDDFLTFVDRYHLDLNGVPVPQNPED
jgi:peptidoglycan/xylan/chitin deacetylase (PgdA/CDA1 family)